jgi:hypothetical protein
MQTFGQNRPMPKHRDNSRPGDSARLENLTMRQRPRDPGCQPESQADANSGPGVMARSAVARLAAGRPAAAAKTVRRLPVIAVKVPS